MAWERKIGEGGFQLSTGLFLTASACANETFFTWRANKKYISAALKGF